MGGGSSVLNCTSKKKGKKKKEAGYKLPRGGRDHIPPLDLGDEDVEDSAKDKDNNNKRQVIQTSCCLLGFWPFSTIHLTNILDSAQEVVI